MPMRGQDIGLSRGVERRAGGYSGDINGGKKQQHIFVWPKVRQIHMCWDVCSLLLLGCLGHRQGWLIGVTSEDGNALLGLLS